MPGLYVPLYVNYADDDKIIEAGPMAELLYVRGLAFVKAMGSDGVITKNQLKRISVRLPRPGQLADRLVEVGLWERNGSGWYIVAWLKRNASAAQIAEAKSVAGVLGNHRRWHLPPDGTPKSECEHCWTDGLVR